MKNYKLTEAEARAIAAEIAKGLNTISHSNPDFDGFAETYMRNFNTAMNALEKYME